MSLLPKQRPTPPLNPHQRWMQDLPSREAGVYHGTRTLGILQAQRQAGSATAYLSKGTRGQQGTTCPACLTPRAADNPVRTLHLPLALHRKGSGEGESGVGAPQGPYPHCETLRCKVNPLKRSPK